MSERGALSDEFHNLPSTSRVCDLLQCEEFVGFVEYLRIRKLAG